jgi:pimeloyl-ACP methyl ester carboxylesterase
VAFIVRDTVRGSRIVLLGRCGHVPWLDQPEATWKALDGFLAPFSAAGATTITKAVTNGGG